MQCASLGQAHASRLLSDGEREALDCLLERFQADLLGMHDVACLMALLDKAEHPGSGLSASERLAAAIVGMALSQRLVTG